MFGNKRLFAAFAAVLVAAVFHAGAADLHFSASDDRQFVDIPLGANTPKNASTLALKVNFAENPGGLVRGVSIHLKSGMGWHSYSHGALNAGENEVRVPLSQFQKEGLPSGIASASTLRISAWKNPAVAEGSCKLGILAINFVQDNIAVVSAGELTAPGEAWAATLAQKCARLLARAGVSSTIVPDTTENFEQYALLFIPYCPTANDTFLKRVEKAMARKTKVVCFYNAPVRLAEKIGVQVGPWQGDKDGHGWCGFRTADGELVPAPTTNLEQLRPLRGAKTLANWLNENGMPLNWPAVVVSERGAWFGHLPPNPSHSAGKFLRKIIKELAPGLAAPSIPEKQFAPVLEDPPFGEFRGIWEPRANSHPRTQWFSMFTELAGENITDCFAHFQSAGTFHFRSRVLPPSLRVIPQRPNPLQDAINASKNSKIRLHAWVTCFSMEGANPAQRTELVAQHRILPNADWLDPDDEQNRKLLSSGILELARSGVAGIHLDYLRYPDRVEGEAAQRRAEAVTRFVREVSSLLRRLAPGVELSAAVFPNVQDAFAMGQQWPAWIKEELVDFVCPMAYTENADSLRTTLRSAIEAGVPAEKIVAGIGTGADESQLDAAGTAAQIAVCRELGLKGFALFAADCELLSSTLPKLNDRK